VKLRRLLGFGAVGWLGWRLFGPSPSPPGQGDQTRPIRIPGRTVFVGDDEMFVRETGAADAPPLVLIHGWSLDGELTFYRVIPELAKYFRVIVPDLRNHGRSRWVRTGTEVEDIADDVAGLFAALGLENAPVFGYSLGGMVVQALVHRHPGLVSYAILGGTAARPIGEHRLATRIVFWLGRAVSRISLHEMSVGTVSYLKKVGGLESGQERWMYEGLMRKDGSLHYDIGNAVWRFDGREWLKRWTTPVSQIIPTEDQVVDPAAQYELAGLLPVGTEVVELVGERHESIITRADEYADVICRVLGVNSEDS
jgi:pimeloyl-ACP methyl ester carboxylesterase